MSSILTKAMKAFQGPDPEVFTVSMTERQRQWITEGLARVIQSMKEHGTPENIIRKCDALFEDIERMPDVERQYPGDIHTL